MLKGTIYITTDESVVNSCINTHKIVILGEQNVENTSFIPASVLLPNYDALEAEANGDMNAFNILYYNHLQSREANEFIGAIIKALIRGINILFFITKDESEMGYCNFLLNYILQNFGINVGTKTQPFTYNPAYDSTICNTLYYMNTIDCDEYLELYPMNLPIDNEPIINKLIFDINPYVEKQDLESYTKYFNNLKNNMHKYNTYLVSPISLAKK